MPQSSSGSQALKLSKALKESHTEDLSVTIDCENCCPQMANNFMTLKKAQRKDLPKTQK